MPGVSGVTLMGDSYSESAFLRESEIHWIEYHNTKSLSHIMIESIKPVRGGGEVKL